MKKLLGLFLVLALCLGIAAPAMAALEQDFENSDLESWRELGEKDYYPITKTEQWTEMDRTQRITACQLSPEQMQTMPTEEMLWAVLKCPFMVELYVFDSYRAGFLHLYDQFPALGALTAREDYGGVLIDTYGHIPVATSETLAEDNYIFLLSVLEILVAQPEMTGCLTDAEREEIVRIAERKHEEKCDTAEINGGNATTFYEAVAETPNSALACAATTATLYTPNKTAVTVTDNYAISDWTSTEKNELNAYFDTAFPTAVRIQDPSKRYNCHSYTWYNNVFSNYYWMDDPRAYMTDGSYTNIRYPVAGYKAFWDLDGSLDHFHSAIVISTGNYALFESKWGSAGVYQHKAGVENCPYGGTITYWRR